MMINININMNDWLEASNILDAVRQGQVITTRKSDTLKVIEQYIEDRQKYYE